MTAGSVPDRNGFYRLLYAVEPSCRDRVRWRIPRDDWNEIRRTFPMSDIGIPFADRDGPPTLLGCPVDVVENTAVDWPELVIANDYRRAKP